MAGQVWSVPADGGFMYSDKLSNFLRIQLIPATKFRQFCDIKEKEAQGKQAGENWTWNVYSKAQTKGDVLDETTVMPETKFTITQQTGTITERGNSVPYTGKLDDLSEHPVREIINKVLKIDAAETMDIGAWTEFDQTPLRVAPDSGNSTTAVTLTTNGATATTNNVAFRNTHVQPIVNVFKDRHIPPYRNDDYYAIGRPPVFDSVRDDLEAIHQYVETGLAMIMNGEIGRYRGVRFCEQTHIPEGGANDSVTFDPQTETADPWNNGLSDWIFFLGGDTVAEGIAVLEEIRGKIPSDYGRSRGVAWYALNGFALTHPDAANARIIKWDSAA
jgi:N4-gp56 family major capsid protein